MIIKSLLEKIVISQQEDKAKRDQGMIRESLPTEPKQASHALIISGIRRCGKSTILYQMINKYIDNPLYLNFDDPRLSDFDKSDWSKLDEIISETGCKELFFDEIQTINEWERYIRQKLDESYKVYVTGSNASLLSRELGTKLTGRHISKELFPFSYTEFISYKNLNNSEISLLEYIKIGGFPEYVKTGDRDILSNLFQDVLIRDIAVRYGIRDLKTLQRLALFLISNVGNRISGTKLKNQFSLGSTNTIMEYLSHLESSYLLFFIPKFSYSLKSQIINPRKVYAIDTGMIEVNSGSFTDDLGSRFENLIFLHLRRHFSEIYYFSEKKECDFVVCKNGTVRHLIQVCYHLDNDNLKRETEGLLEAMKFFNIQEGTIVSFNQKDNFIIENYKIYVIPAFDYISNKNL